MSVSSPFIHRPIATSLLGVAVMLGGFLGYWWLPVSALPQVDFPTIQVTTQLPGANPDTIAALVTAPLERQFGQIPALQTMTSSSSFGISQVTLQFDLNRDIHAAAAVRGDWSRPRLGARRYSAGDTNPGRPVAACSLWPRIGGRAHGHRWRQCGWAEGLARRHASVLHHRSQ